MHHQPSGEIHASGSGDFHGTVYGEVQHHGGQEKNDGRRNSGMAGKQQRNDDRRTMPENIPDSN